MLRSAEKERAPGPPLGWLAGDRALVVMRPTTCTPPSTSKVLPKPDRLCNAAASVPNLSGGSRRNLRRNLRETGTVRCSYSDCKRPSVVSPAELDRGFPPLCGPCLGERAGFEEIR